MRDNPSNVPSGGPLRPAVGVLALVVVVALAVLLVPGGPLGGGEPTEVVATASENDRLVGAERVHQAADTEPGAPVGRAALRAHDRGAPVRVNATAEQVEVVDLSLDDRRATWVRVDESQYRVTVERRAS